MNAKKNSCPICGGPRKGRKENEHFPFCSKRCKTQDLANWFGEDYSIQIGANISDRKLEEDETDAREDRRE